MKRHANFIGSDFDDFLREEGLLEDTETAATKRVFIFELENKPSSLRKLCEIARAVCRRTDIYRSRPQNLGKAVLR